MTKQTNYSAPSLKCLYLQAAGEILQGSTQAQSEGYVLDPEFTM